MTQFNSSSDQNRPDLAVSFTRFLRRRSAWVAAPALLSLTVGPMAQAVTVDWDPTISAGVTLGGPGTWANGGATNWWDGSTNIDWDNANLDTARFGGTPGSGLVTLDAGGVTAGGLVFDTTGYILSGGPLALGGATPTVSVTNLADVAVVNSVISGSTGLTVSGAGKLVLGGANTFTGGVNVNSGTLSGAVATGTNPFGNNTITLAGGTLDLTPTATANAGNQGLSYRTIVTSAATGDTSRIDFTNTAAAAGSVATVNSATTVPGPGGAPVNTGVQYTGKLKITNAGSYTFQIGSDDGSRLYIDGVLVINNDGSKGVTGSNTPTPITLSAGLHDIRMDYVNGGGGAGATLSYSGPDQLALGAIPTTALFQAETHSVAGSSNAVVVGSGLGNALNVTSNSTVNLNGGNFTQVQFGDYNQTTGTTLSLTGLSGKTLRLAGNTTLGTGAGTVTIDATPNVAFSGALSDGGNAMTVVKTGNGRLIFDQTAVANTLGASTTFDIQGGSAVLIGSTASGANNPIGSAAIQLNGGNLVLDSKGATIAGVGPTYNNAVSLAAGKTGTIQSIVNAATTTLGGGSNGVTLGASSALNLDAIAGGQPVADPGATLVLAGPLVGPSTSTVNIMSSILGTFASATRGIVALAGNNTGFAGTMNVPASTTLQLNNTGLPNATLNLAGTLNLFTDGNGSAAPETIAMAASPVLTGVSTIAVNRLGTTYAPLFTTPANKTVQIPSLTTGGFGLTVNNTNGYGLAVSGVTTLSGTESFTVSTASSSAPLLVHGLSLNGKVTGTAAGGITKAGAGTMVLTNATNDFVGNLAITGGLLATTSDAALGAAANTITLNGVGAAFQALDTFSTSRTFTFSNATVANNLLLVAGGKTLTINTALTGTNGFQKGDPGVLVLTSGTSTISGAVVASGGALRITNAGALGTTSGLSVAGNEGSAFQLDGTGGAINFARPVSLGATSGIQNNGALENFAGDNTVSGAITLTGAATIGNSASGTTLNITGGVSGAQGLTFNGVGDTTISTTALGAVTGLTRNGSGTTTIAVASPLFVSATAINAGALVISGSGSIGNGAVTNTVTSGGTLWVDDTGTANATRFGSTRTLNLSSGTFRYTANGTAASSQAVGTLSSSWGGNTIRVDNLTGSANSTLTFAGLAGNAVSGGSTLVFESNAAGTGATFGSNPNKVVFTAAPTLTNGIIQRALVFDSTGGSPTYNFATHSGAATSIAAYAGYNASNDVVSALATDTMRLTASANTTASRTLNAIASSGPGLVLDGTSLQTLTLTSGNILVQSGDLNIGSNLMIATGGTEMGLNVAPGATLNVYAPMTNANNVTTGLGGTINLNTRQFFNTGANWLTMNGGTVKLNGGNGTLFGGQTTGANQMLAVGPGATLDLNGTAQTAGDLRSPNNNAFFGSGGTVTSTGGAATLVSRQANANWGGQITGPVTFVMGNNAIGNVERFYQDNTYTGRTLVTGGALELTDAGRLSGTSAIDLNQGVLNILNTSASNGRFNLTDRIPNATPINLSGGAILFAGRSQTQSTETLGTVTLVRGNSNINITSGGVGVNSSELTITNLVQGSMDASTNVQGATGQAGSLARLFIGNGTSLLSNNILPAWIQFSGNEFMSYNSTMGAMALSAVGAPGYTGTTLPAVNSLATAAGNYRIGASGVVPTGGLTVNTLNINGAFNVTFGTATDVLNIGASGLIKSGATGTSIGSVVDEGRLTAGGATPVGTVPLYLYNGVNGNSFTLNSRIVDNGASPIRLVVNNFNGGTTVLTNPNNSYTGGTVINGWVNAAGGGLSVTGIGLIPAGGVTINNSTLTTTAAGQIHASNTVTVGGSSTLTMVGNNTLVGLNVDNYGGMGAPTINTGGVLSLTGTITASSSNVSTLPVINGTLDFGGTGRTLTINPIAYNGVTLNALQPTMNIAGVIQNAGLLTKAGNGLLQLSGQSTFAGGVSLTAGGLVFGASSTPTGGTPLSGPLGTGTLTTAAGTTLLSTTAVNLANDLTIIGDLNFDGLNNINFNGTTTLPLSPLTINVAAPQQTVGLLGDFVNPSTNITKTGYGTLNLSSFYTGTLTLPDGGAFSLLDDGNGSGTQETLAAGASVVATGATSVTVGRTGVDFAPYYPQALNKTIQIANLSTGGAALTVNNVNGYGLDMTGAQTLVNDQIYSVTTATASNVVQGLTISGKVSGAFNLTKTGNGTLVLGNNTNDFGGTGKAIDIQGGVVAAANDAVLGNSANVIRLNSATGNFRATGTYTTARTIEFAQSTNGIEVAGGNTLTLTSPFTGVSATSKLVKSEAGILELNVANSGSWTGTTTLAGVMSGGVQVNAGYVKISNAAALGNAANPIIVTGLTNAGILIDGGINVPNPATLNTTAGNNYAGGLNWGGTLRSLTGNNTWSGLIQINQDSGISADSGSTLNLTGGIAQNAHIMVYGGAGNINVTTGGITAVHSLDKIGSGTLNVQVPTAAPTGNGIRVYAGTLTFSGAGAVSGPGTVATVINPGGTVNLDSSGTVTPNRLGGRAMTMLGGNLNLIGGSTVTNEAIGAPTFNRGQSTITVTSGTGGANLTFTAASNNVAPAQTTAGSGATVLFRGTSLGTAAGAGVSSVQWTGGGLLFNGQTGATGTTTKGIVPWAIIDTTATGLGTSFVTGDSAAAAANTVALLRPLAAGEYASGTLAVNNNMLVTTALTAQPTVAPNSLTIDTGGSIAIGSAVSGTAPVVGNTLSLSSGGILVRNGVTSSISGGILAQPAANSPWNIHTIGTAELTISSTMNGGNSASNIGLVKAGGGTLILSTPKSTIPGLTALSANTLIMQTAVNQGTLKLNGGTNTLGANNYLAVGPGGTLDLNGTSQHVLGLFTDGTYNGIADTVTAGGTVTNTSATMATLVTNSDARNWAGQITGNVFYNRTGGASTTTIYTPQTYTGGTLINGGTVSLRDYGKLSGTSDISVNFAGLALDNTQAAGITGRLGSAPITLRGATLTYTGRASTASTETIGAISLALGWSNIAVAAGGTGINSAELTIPSLTRPSGSSAVVNLANGNGGAAQTGQIGSTPRLLISSTSLSNNLLGPWAIASREWASYVPTLGTGKLNDPGFAGYSASTLAAATATENIRILNTNTTLTADAVANTVNFQFNGNLGINLGGAKLTLTSGGLMFGTGNDNVTGSLTNGTVTSGFANGAVNDLYVFHLPYAGNNRQAAIGAVVADNGATPVRLILSSSEGSGSANRLTLNGVNTYTGGTVVNQGTVLIGATGAIPTGGITLNGGALNQAIANQATPGAIAAGNIVTLNGTATLNLSGPNTLAGLVFNNNGGNVAPTVNTFIAGAGTDGRGTLTIGASGIVADSSNVQTTSVIQGRIDMGASANTITVNPITVNGASVGPLQAALAIQGITGSAGGITKAGNGVLQLNAQSNFTGPLTVTAGGINVGTVANSGLTGASQPGSRYSALTLNANTWLNLSNTDATFGSLAGSGTVINTSTASTNLPLGRTFNIGFDNTNTTFSGSFARWSDVQLNPYQVNKIGTGTMTLTGLSTTTSALQVSQGGVTYSGANGSGQFGTTIILPTATLTLDNSAANKNNRLSGATNTGTLTMSGGNFKIIGNASAATNETIGTFNIAAAGNLNGASVITLQANAAQALTFTVGTTFGGMANSSGLIRGISATAASGNANFVIGSIGLGAPAGSGTGANGTTTMPIRPDILGDASVTGSGTAFITKDSATNFLRPLTAAEMEAFVISGANNPTVNFGLSTTASLGASGQFGSLTLNSGGGLQSFVTSSTLDGLPINSQVVSGGILAFSGNTNITVGRLQTGNNSLFRFHTLGNLTVNSVLNGTNGGFVKSGAGSLTLGSKALYTGQTSINEGTLILNGGNQTLPVLATGGVPTTSSTAVNGGTLDLNGNSQIIGTLFNNGSARYANTGGTFTNSATGTAVDFSTNMGSAQTFGGVIAGNLNFQKAGNVALSLASPNTFTGSTNIRANTLTLLDAGTLSNTSAVNLFYAGLNIDQSGLNPVGDANPTRIPAATPINLRGSTLTLTAGGSMDATATFNTVNLLQAHSTVSVPQAPAGSSAAMTIGNLVRTGNLDATVNLTGGANGFFSNNPGLNQSNLYINSINGTAIPATIPGKILGGWALANNGEFVTYVSPTTTGANGLNYGVVTLNGTTGASGLITQTQYDATAITAAGTATTNVRLGGNGTLVSGGTTYNSLAVRAAATITFTNAADVLNLASGGLALTAGAAQVVGSAVGNGVVTSGGTATGVNRLYVYNNGGVTFNSAIANSGVVGASTRLVLTPISGAITINGVNTYTGGTAINGSGGTVTLSSTSSAIPAGGLTLNNVAVTSSVAANIAAANDVTLNGGSTLTLTGANTLNSLTFNNNGGTGNPTVTIGATSLALTATNAITAVNDNLATVPTIAGTLLTLPAGANIDTSTTVGVPTGLAITSPIASAGAINKTNNGSLLLSGASTFTGGVNLNGGTIILGANSTGAVTNGPLGTGTLTMANGTALISDTAVRTIANAIVLNGNITLGSTAGIANASTVAANGVILNGTMNLGAATRTIDVNSFLNVSTIGGVISGASGTGLTKTGAGTLVLTGVNTYDGGTNINGGVVQTNSTGLGSAGTITFGGGILRHAATTTTDFSARFATTNNQPFYIDTNNQTITYASALTSATGGSLGKFGAGTLILTNTANYNGNTLINEGTLQVGAGGTVGDIPNATNISNNGALIWDRSNNDSLTGIISGIGSITKRGVGNLILSGVNTFTGNVTMNAATPATAGSITITNSQSLGLGPKTVTIISNNGAGVNQAQLLLDGSGGPISLASNLSFTTSQASLTQPAIVNVAGNNEINGNFTLASGGGATSIFSTTGNLELKGNFTTNTSGRNLILGGSSTGTGNISGVIGQGSVPNQLALIKEGTNEWTLSNVANTYTGSTTLNGGTLSIAAIANGGTNSSIGASSNAATNLIFNGGGLKYTGATASTDRSFTINAAQTAVIDIDATLTNLTVSGTSAATTGGLTKAGPGTLTVTGTHSYSGMTTVSEGTFALGSAADIPNSTVVNIASGATLDSTAKSTWDISGKTVTVNGELDATAITGTNTTLNGAGIINGTTTLTGGIVSPGNSPGLLTSNGNFTTVGSTFVMDIDGTTPATQYDQLSVTGVIDIGTTSVLSLNFGAIPSVGDKYFLILNDGSDSINGLFAGIADGAEFVASGFTFSAHYGADSGSGNLTGGNDFALYTVIPEPSNIVLLAFAVSSVFLRRRRAA